MLAQALAMLLLHCGGLLVYYVRWVLSGELLHTSPLLLGHETLANPKLRP